MSHNTSPLRRVTMTSSWQTSMAIAISVAMAATLLIAWPTHAADAAATCASAASDPDGDGWGWENDASCRVANDANDSDTNPTRTPTCQSILADPDGDGWGWENEASCKMPTSFNLELGGPLMTDDTIPLGVFTEDWDPSVDTISAPMGSRTDRHGRLYCQSASSDPDGDGWGWENGSSCVVRPLVETIDLDVTTHIGAAVLTWNRPWGFSDPTYTVLRFKGDTGELTDEWTTTDEFLVAPAFADPADVYSVAVVDDWQVKAGSMGVSARNTCEPYCDTDEITRDVFVHGGHYSEIEPVVGVDPGIHSIDFMPWRTWKELAQQVARALLKKDLQEIYNLPFQEPLADLPETVEGMVTQTFGNTVVRTNTTTGVRVITTFWGTHEDPLIVETVSTPQLVEPAWHNGEPMFDRDGNRILAARPNTPTTNVTTVKFADGTVLAEDTTVTSPTGGIYRASNPGTGEPDDTPIPYTTVPDDCSQAYVCP